MVVLKFYGIAELGYACVFGNPIVFDLSVDRVHGQLACIQFFVWFNATYKQKLKIFACAAFGGVDD
jgi:hypothetical protein